MIKFCRYCDLGFCEEHDALHRDLDDKHELGDWPPNSTPFCCVCTGIYAPPPLGDKS